MNDDWPQQPTVRAKRNQQTNQQQQKTPETGSSWCGMVGWRRHNNVESERMKRKEGRTKKPTTTGKTLSNATSSLFSMPFSFFFLPPRIFINLIANCCFPFFGLFPHSIVPSIAQRKFCSFVPSIRKNINFFYCISGNLLILIPIITKKILFPCNISHPFWCYYSCYRSILISHPSSHPLHTHFFLAHTTHPID